MKVRPFVKSDFWIKEKLAKLAEREERKTTLECSEEHKQDECWGEITAEDVRRVRGYA